MTKRLREAVEVFLTNIVDSGGFGPIEGDWGDDDGYDVDADGDAWYADIWELKEALKEDKPECPTCGRTDGHDAACAITH